MSIEAVEWALQQAPCVSTPARLVLVYLAERADERGRGTYPSADTIGEHLQMGERTVRRWLAYLEDAGITVRGDQGLVEDYPADKRPVVWDLDLRKKRQKRQKRGAGSGQSGVPKVAKRGAESGHNEVPEVAVDHPSGVPVLAKRGAGSGQSGVPKVAPKPSIAPTELNHPVPPTEVNRPGAADANAPAPDDLGFSKKDAGGSGQGSQAKVIHLPTSARTRGIRLPADWTPDERHREWTRKQGLTTDEIRFTLTIFRNYWIAKTGKDATKTEPTGWNRTWQNWVLKEIREGKVGPNARGRTQPAQKAVGQRWDAGTVYR